MSRPVSCAVICLLLICGVFIPAPAADKLRIIDTTTRGVTPVKQEVLRFALETGIETSVLPQDIDWAVEKFKAGEADILIVESGALPGEFRKNAAVFAFDALAVYVNTANSLRDIQPEKLREVLIAPTPVWQPLNGDRAQIHRYTLKNGAPGFGLAEKVLKIKKLSPAMLVFNSGREVAMLTAANPMALGIARYLTEPPGGTVPLKISGIAPRIKTIRSGEYPLQLAYCVVTNSAPATKKFLNYLNSNHFYRLLLDDGLLPASAR